MKKRKSSEKIKALTMSKPIEEDVCPIVVGYQRVSANPNTNESRVEVQQAPVLAACERRFPQGFQLIFIADEGCPRPSSL